MRVTSEGIYGPRPTSGAGRDGVSHLDLVGLIEDSGVLAGLGEAALVSKDDLDSVIASELVEHGYERAGHASFDLARQLDSESLLAFVMASQQRAWESLVASRGERGARSALLDAVVDKIEEHGTVAALRTGVSVDGVAIDLAYFAPRRGSDSAAEARRRLNRGSVIHRLLASAGQRLPFGLVLTLNGLPIVTLEAVDSRSGLTVDDAIERYARRSLDDVLLQRRAVVHFALDSKRVAVATGLTGSPDDFYPFNRGSAEGGAGNAATGHLYRTAYLWEETLSFRVLLDLIGNLVPSRAADGGPGIEWPRLHQLDLVKRLQSEVETGTAGQRFLVSHSAGSDTAWTLAFVGHALARQHDLDGRRVFHKVVVATDRQVVTEKLEQICSWGGGEPVTLVEATENAALSAERAAIVVVAPDQLINLFSTMRSHPQRRFVVVCDEPAGALRRARDRACTQTLSLKSLKAAIPEMAQEMALADAERWERVLEGKAPDPVEEIVTALSMRGVRSNVTLTVFSRSPSVRERKLFSRRELKGVVDVWHSYPTRQAIEEGYLLDVLDNYEARPQLHSNRLKPKAEAIVEHFKAVTADKIEGRAKALVVTRSRLHAVHLKRAVDDYAREHGYEPLGSLVSFTGAVTDESNEEHSQDEVNGFPDGELAERFALDHHRLLISAGHQHTGLDMPLLHTLFVDKELDEGSVVDTLFSVALPCAGKKDTSVVDFVNTGGHVAHVLRAATELAPASYGRSYTR